ncbi:family 16 glycoside hydrolase, partial [Ligaoa zhengdingensis]
MYWLYNRLYDSSNPSATKWLLDLGALLESQTTDWTYQYNDTTVRQHVVNTSQGMKTPAVFYQYSGEERDKIALQNGLLNMSIDHGRVDGLPNSDEAARENRSTRGTENCGIVEGLLSTEIAQKVLGEAWIGDRIEQLAYNALPAAYTPDLSGHVYYVLQNQVMATLGNHEFGNDHGDSSAFGAPCGFDCCYSNTHMGWPKFVQNMWMATADNGLAIVAYGPNKVTAKVADGKTAVFLQETDYPFKDSVKLAYGGDTARFELKVRIPAWAAGATVTVNGVAQEGVATGDYYTIERTWVEGDVVDLEFPSEIKTSTWYNDSVAVEKGALIYGLKIEEDWRTYESNDARELKVEHQPQSPLREVYPASAWNYGLIVNPDDPASSFEVVEFEDVALQPFSSETAPVVLKAKGQLIPDWTYDGNLAGPQPYGPTAYDESLVRDIELIPYGSGRLRIAHFPKIGEATDTVVKTAALDSEMIRHNGTDYQEFANIVVPQAKSYTLKVTGSGSGTLVINNKYSQALDLSSGEAEVTDLQNKLSGGFQFTAGHYNNIRFTTSLNVESIEVIPVGRTITDIVVKSSNRNEEAIKINTNLDWQETPYKVVYGTESGNYTNTVYGFESSTATITGIDESKDYYAKVIAFIQGEQKESEELVFLSSTSSEGGLKPNPGVPNATYAGFPTLNYMDRDWTKFDPEGKVEFVQNGDTTNIKFGKGPKVKAVLLPEDAQGNEYTLDWVDYVVEATLSVDAVDNNSCGVMFRSTNIGDDPDEFHGYFAGIGYLNVGNIDGAPYKGPGLMIGYADGGWHDIQPLKADIQPGEQYTLKVVVFGDRFAVYLDNELMATFRDDQFGNGTVGLRSYNEAFTAYSLSVRPVEQEDLVDFEEDEVVEIHPDPDAPNAVYEGLGTQAEIESEWTKYDPEDKIEFIDNGIVLGKGPKVKAALTLDGAQAQAENETQLAADEAEPAEESAPVEEPAAALEQTPAETPAEDEAVLAPMAALTLADGEPEAQPEEDVEEESVEASAPRMLRAGSEADDPLTWTDYVVEAELSVDMVDNNNCGLMFRATEIGDDPDAYHGFFAGIGLAGGKPGVMVGYADGGWHDIKIIPKEIVAGQKYDLKVVVFGDKFAVYLNNDLQYVGDASLFSQGTVGVRSYNEAFKVYDVTVRNIEQNDLVVFGGKPDAVAEELFSEDFEDAQAAAATWTKVPANANITFASGEVSLGSTTDIKLTAGDESWDNYVYEADVKIATNGNNSGIIFRTTQEGSGADNYYGYYFGLNSTGFEIGKSSNSWTQLVSKTYDVHPGSYHRLKVMAYNSNFKFYIDDVLVHSMKDGTHAAGKIGLRGYNRSFTADNVMVRTLSAEEIEEMSVTTPVDSMTISAAPFYNGFQVHYPKGNAATYKVQFGTEPGVYTHEFVDVKFNNYGGKMEADKVAVAVPAPGTYYVRLVGLSGTTPVSISNEVEVTTGYNEPTESDRAKMNAALADAKAADTSAYTKTSKARLDEAIAAAEALTAQDDASQMDLSLAASMLKVALRVTDSEDIVFTKPVNNAALAEGTLAGTRFTGDFAGGKTPAQSTVLKAEIASTAAGDAQLSLSASAENAAICYVVKAEAPASASEYTNLYTAPISVSVANGESIWVEVTAEDGETKLYYKVEVSTYNEIDSVAVKLFAPEADTIISETGEASVDSEAPYTHVSTGWTGATGLLLNDAPEARYAGFGSQAETVPNWTEYDPENKVSFTADSAEGKTSIHVGTGPRVKAALNVAGSSEWTDYVVEADLSVGTNDNNNAGIMLRATNIGNDSDEYNGLFVGIGYVPGNTQAQAVMIGYADGKWHDIKPIPHPIEVNRVYNLKVVAYGQNFAVYLDDEFISTFTNSTFTKGTVGVRSYNTPFDVYDLTVRPLVKDDLKVFANNGLKGEVWANGDIPVATVRLAAKDGYTFKGLEAKDILVDIGNNIGASVSFASGQGVSTDGKTLTFTATYPEVGAVIKEALQQLIESAEALNEDSYTPETWAKLAEALTEAKGLIGNDAATQDQVNAAYDKLEAAIGDLDFKPVDPSDVDKTALKALIAAVDGKYDEGRYTAESWKALTEALNAAKAVVADAAATESQVFDAYLALV